MTKGQKMLSADLATDYETALTRLGQVQAFDAKLKLNPNCHTQLLTHGNKVERVIILI